MCLPPAAPLFAKDGTTIEFLVPHDIVEILVRPIITCENLLFVLNIERDDLLNVFRGASIAAKVHQKKIQKLREKLEREFAHLQGEEYEAGQMLVNKEKEKEGRAIGIGMHLISATRMLTSGGVATVSQFVLMEAILPSLRTICADKLYWKWIDTVEDVVKNPALYISASQIAMDYCFFDLESTGLLPDGRVTCAVTQHGDDVRTWCSKSKDENKYQLMTEETANELVEYLYEFSEGKRVVTFNGAAFDFKMLFLHLNDQMMCEKLKTIAMNHFDMHLACIDSAGHRMGLNGIVKATLGQDESKSGSGLDAIKWWDEEKYDLLFSYCAKDVLLLKLVWQYAAENNIIFYLPKREGSSRKAVAMDAMHRSANIIDASIFADKSWDFS